MNETTRRPYGIKFKNWLPRLLGHDAVTIRKTIRTRLAPVEFTPDLHAHEYCHIEQWARLGVVSFLWHYLWGHKRMEMDAIRYSVFHRDEFPWYL